MPPGTQSYAQWLRFHQSVIYWWRRTSTFLHAYNGVGDYQSISTVPVYHANLPVGHGGASIPSIAHTAAL